MLNGASNRRGRPSVKTLVLHSNTSYILVLYTGNNATNQTINYQVSTIHITQMGVIKDKKKRKMKKGARCMVYGA